MKYDPAATARTIVEESMPKSWLTGPNFSKGLSPKARKLIRILSDNLQKAYDLGQRHEFEQAAQQGRYGYEI